VKLQRLIDANHVYLGLDVEDAESALAAVADRVSGEIKLPAARIVKALVERERMGSTSVGDGFAIPHCKLNGLEEIFIALARLEAAIEFGAGDGKGVEFIFVVLSPPDQPAAHLQVLSQIARVLKRSELRHDLMRAVDRDGVVETIRIVAESEGL
jgi:mannitol/fructose-specific phosphotransferase system IIA component (Ntr-type)